MDSLTHLASGIILPLAFRSSPRRAAVILIGVCATMLPDLDIVAGVSAEARLNFHRSVTHALIILPIFALFLGLLFKFGLKLFYSLFPPKSSKVKIVEGSSVVFINPADSKFSNFFIIAFFGLLLHVYFDCMTMYGTQILWPFDLTRVRLPSMYIVDPIFTIPIIYWAIRGLIGFSNEEKREGQVKRARRAVVWMIFYPIVTLGIGYGVAYYLNYNYSTRPSSEIKFTALNTPGSPIYWKVVGETEDNYYMKQVSLVSLFTEDHDPFIEEGRIEADNFPSSETYQSGTTLPEINDYLVYPVADADIWDRGVKELPIFKTFADFGSFVTSEDKMNGEYIEYTFSDLRYLAAGPNDFLSKLGLGKGFFVMQLLVDPEDGDIAGWRFVADGKDLPDNAGDWIMINAD